jgi:DNA polymerase-3 subunit epsilon
MSRSSRNFGLSNSDRGEDGAFAAFENARKRTVRIWAEQSPFDLKDELKTRGYRSSSGEDGRRKAWYVDVSEDDEADEIGCLKDHIYRREVDLFTPIVPDVEWCSVRV